MKPKKIIPIITFILLINTTLAIDFLRPEIEVFWDEPIIEGTLTINITDESGDLWDLENVSSDGQKFVYKPVGDLPEGLYKVIAEAEDEEGNLGSIELTFLVQIPPLDIDLIEPTLGVSPIKPFDFIIRTDRWADCKYTFLIRDYDDMDSSFSTTNNLLHQEIDFETTGKVYIKCKDEYDKITPASFDLAFDDSPPDITYKHADDVTEFPIETTLIVRTSDETVCKYYMEDSQIDYSHMNPFSGYDESNGDSYKLENQQILDEDDLEDYKVNRVYIRCKNKAELLSVTPMEYVDINVDTSEAPLIIINKPESAISDTTPLFDVTTNKDSDCKIANNSDMLSSINMGGVQTREHTKELTNALSAGTYTYYVECIFDVEGPIKTSVTFTIDDTPPNMTYVDIKDYNDTGKVYDDDELCAEWKGEDDESVIESYAYYLYWDKPTDELIEYGITSPAGDNEYCFEDLELNDSESYYFEVSAENIVGLWSKNKTSSSVKVDLSLLPESCGNGRKDGDETDVDCGGNCEGCDEGENCFENSDCDSNYCNSSNKCAEPECDDGVKNGGETDVDCGGNCKGCDVGDDCNDDGDCKSNNCDASTGRCDDVLDSCENGKLDVGETDIDCGGDCPSCEIGQNCDSDSDCIKLAKCEKGVCESDVDDDGVIDDEDNCPDMGNEDQADVDGDDIGDMCDNDNDNDGLPDSFEQQYFDCTTCVDPDDDPDNDGLTNLDEYTYNTNPTNPDTDGDGYPDKEEIEKGYDPLDPSSHPEKNFWKYFFIFFGLIVLGAGGYYGYKMFMQKKKPFVPPRAGMGRLMRLGIRRPVRMVVRRPMRRPMQRIIKPPLVKGKEIIKKGLGLVKPGLSADLGKTEEDIFKRLSKISKAERIRQVEKHAESLKLTDKELKERIGKLKKDLKVK